MPRRAVVAARFRCSRSARRRRRCQQFGEARVELRATERARRAPRGRAAAAAGIGHASPTGSRPAPWTWRGIAGGCAHRETARRKARAALPHRPPARTRVIHFNVSLQNYHIAARPPHVRPSGIRRSCARSGTSEARSSGLASRVQGDAGSRDRHLLHRVRHLPRAALRPAARIDEFRPRIERAVSDKLHAQLSIGKLSPNWSGMQPGVELTNLTIRGHDGKVALSVPLDGRAVVDVAAAAVARAVEPDRRPARPGRRACGRRLAEHRGRRRGDHPRRQRYVRHVAAETGSDRAARRHAALARRAA